MIVFSSINIFMLNAFNDTSFAELGRQIEQGVRLHHTLGKSLVQFFTRGNLDVGLSAS